MAEQRRKPSTSHRFAAIEHRVIDSPAYADLTFSAQALLTLFARQLTKTNNGHLQASFAWCKKFGFGSEHTLQNAIADLLAHGFIYRTRSHGANKIWAKYAVTWLSVTEKTDLFLAGFKPFAWREWTMTNKKITPQKVQEPSSRKCSFNNQFPAESAGITPAKSADYELATNIGNVADLDPALPVAQKRRHPILKSPFSIRLSVTADRGLLRLTH